MTDDQKKAYGRGYTAGSRSRWPEHRPPLPPDPLVRRLLAAAQTIRDGHDKLLATLGPGDDFEQELGPGIDALDAAMREVTDWLRNRH